MNNKTSKILLNGVLLAAMAAVGMTAYQLVTSPLEEELLPNEIQIEMAETGEESEKEPLMNANTTNVTAQLKDSERDPAEEPTDNSEKMEAEDFSEEEKTEVSEESEDKNEKSGKEDAFLENETAETALASVGAVIPAAAYLNFSENTLMEWPVHGNILLDYNMDQTTYFPTLDQYRLNPAISVQAAEGAPVMASVEGVVYDISENPRTGTTVTMELGNGYQAIYGQLRNLTIYEGETVTKGTTIGYIDAPTKYYSEEGSNLYFAMKKDGSPIDPILYLP